MKIENIYLLLIILMLFLFFKKILAVIIDLAYPTYKPPPTGIWADMVYVRDSITFLSAFYILALLILMGKNTNTFITTLLVLLFVYDILYFLLDWGYIFLFIEKTPHIEHLVHLADNYLNSGMNIIIGIGVFYALIFIFYNRQ